MLAATRVFARPATHFRKFHFSAPSHNEEAPHFPLKEPLNDEIEFLESLSKTNQASAPATQQPYQIYESWKSNDFYSPLDFLRSRRIIAHRRSQNLSSVGPGAKEALYNDAFRQLDINPVFEANNTALLGDFVTDMGKIRPRAQTGLSWRSQRMVSRAIKRAKQKGVLAILCRNFPASPGRIRS